MTALLRAASAFLLPIVGFLLGAGALSSSVHIAESGSSALMATLMLGLEYYVAVCMFVHGGLSGCVRVCLSPATRRDADWSPHSMLCSIPYSTPSDRMIPLVSIIHGKAIHKHTHTHNCGTKL